MLKNSLANCYIFQNYLNPRPTSDEALMPRLSLANI